MAHLARENRKSSLAVCIIVENMPVPADRRVWQEARALVEAGYQVSVICPKGRGFSQSHEHLEGVEIYRHYTREASGKLGYLIEYGWAMMAEFVLAVRVYRRTRFRVLQACNPPDTIFLIALFFKLWGVRFVFDHHDPTPELYAVRFGSKGLMYRLLRVAEKVTFRTADVTISTNETLREMAIAQSRVDPSRSYVVKGCPELKKFQLRAPRPELRAGRQHLVVYVGIMGPQDGVDLLLDSIEYLVKEKGRSDTLFALVGTGTEVHRLTALACAKGLSGSVKFTGALYGDDLLAYLATADVGVAPDPFNDFNDKLTMIKILEYMACKLPVVIYDLAEGRRSAGDSAVYAKPNNVVDFGERIGELLDKPLLRAQLGLNGRARVEERLNWEFQKQILLQAYETALS